MHSLLWSLSSSIKTSSDPQAGVYITELTPNSVAHNAGLKVNCLTAIVTEYYHVILVIYNHRLVMR